MSSLALANFVFPNAGGTWQTVDTTGANPTIANEVITSSTSNGAGSAYWNNSTFDSDGTGTGGNCYNVGCFMTNSGGWTGNPNSPALDNPVYWGSSTTDGNAVTDFYLSNSPASGVPVTLLIELAGNRFSNWMGWYDQDLVNTSGLGALTAANFGTNWGVIFEGSDAPNTSVAFTPTTNFGFWFLPNQSAGALTPAQLVTALGNNGMFTESSRNTGAGDANNQYFTLWARSAAAASTLPVDFWMGIEDVRFGAGSDQDYNDMILRLTIVPEPGYYALLAAGLAGLGWMRRRKKMEA